MGRPPCCDKSRVKKGPWSPEEDLLLATHVRGHGPGNWRAVPADTGLMRCSKSCRLRWTNYLRPGIKRGGFSDEEEKLIIQLQELLGNRWSAIATYMADRTDNDIKNYWNTHLKRKLAKTGASRETGQSSKTKGDTAAAPANKGQWERRLQTDFYNARQAFQEAVSVDTAPPPAVIKPEPPLPEPEAIGPAMYAYSIENIARLLKDWIRPSASGKAPAAGGGEGGSGSHSGTAGTLLGFTGTMTKVDGAGGAGPGPSSSSLPMLESWLFDDGMGHSDAGLMGVQLAYPCEFF